MEPMIVLLPHHTALQATRTKHRPNSHAPEGDTNEARNEMAENMEKNRTEIPKTEKKIREHQSVSIPTATVKFPSALLSAALASAVA